MPTRPSLYRERPRYRVDIEPATRRWRASVDGATIADSIGAVLVFETDHDPVVYFPRGDVDMSLLERTEHHTFCPFKGDASYWSIRVGDRLLPNAVWTYEDVFEEVMPLKDYVAFYPDRVQVEEA